MSRIKMVLNACLVITIMGLAPISGAETDARKLKQQKEVQQVEDRYKQLKLRAFSPQQVKSLSEDEVDMLYWVRRRHLESDIDHLKREIWNPRKGEDYPKTLSARKEYNAAKLKLLEQAKRSLWELKESNRKIDLERVKKLPKNIKIVPILPIEPDDVKKVRERETLVQHRADMTQFLLDTGDAVIVEASPRDRIWGIGMGASNENATNPAKWRGQNLLGSALMDVRQELRK